MRKILSICLALAFVFGIIGCPGAGEKLMVIIMPDNANPFFKAEADAADAKDDEAISLDDAIYILFHLFKQGPLPPAPYPECGIDTTPNPDPSEPDLPHCDYDVGLCQE